MHRLNSDPKPILAVLVGIAALFVSGCSSSTDTADSTNDNGRSATTTTTTTAESSTDSDTAEFCAAGATINTKTGTITSPEEAASVFTELDPTLETMVASAPADVADAAATFVTTARASVASGDFTPFEDGTVDALVEQFDAVCADR